MLPDVLFTAQMKLSGETDLTQLEADYKVEMGRIKEAQGRVGELEARANMQRIDRAAARRFVQHGLGLSRRKRGEWPNIC